MPSIDATLTKTKCWHCLENPEFIVSWGRDSMPYAGSRLMINLQQKSIAFGICVWHTQCMWLFCSEELLSGKYACFSRHNTSKSLVRTFCSVLKLTLWSFENLRHWRSFHFEILNEQISANGQKSTILHPLSHIFCFHFWRLVIESAWTKQRNFSL